MQQWIDLARYTGLQTRNSESLDASNSVEVSAIEGSSSEETNVNDVKNQ